MARRKKKKKAPVDYIVYTDGGCSANPGGAGGYGAVIINQTTGEEKEVSGGYYATTNNRMEMIAIREGLKNTPEGATVRLVSDSQYALNCLQNIWNRNKNTDLWPSVEAEAKKRVVTYEWTRGHSGNKYNERCDALAAFAITSPTEEDAGYIKAKEAGRNFFKKVEAQEKKTGTMSISINVPPSFPKRTNRPHSKKEYAEQFHVHDICAKAILEFEMFDARTFKSYISLKTGGIDHWSRKKTEDIAKETEYGDLAEMVIRTNLTEEKDIASAMRWYARGLDLSDAIRKILVDKEVSQNCR